MNFTCVLHGDGGDKGAGDGGGASTDGDGDDDSDDIPFIQQAHNGKPLLMDMYKYTYVIMLQ